MTLIDGLNVIAILGGVVSVGFHSPPEKEHGKKEGTTAQAVRKEADDAERLPFP